MRFSRFFALTLAGVVSAAISASTWALTYTDAVLADSPVAYYRLNETAGATASSLGSAAGADGTYAGGPTLGVPGPSSVGSANRAVDFAAGRVDLASGFLPTGSSARTYEMFFNADSVSPAAQAAFSYGTNANGQRINVTADNSTVAVAVNGHNFGKTGLSLSGWNHLAVTLPAGGDSNDWRFFVNGEEQFGLTNLAGSTTTVNTANQPGRIGGNIFGGASYGGILDEVAIYDTDLTPNQIANHYGVATGIFNLMAEDLTTAARNGESPATSGAFAATDLFVRERANNNDPQLEVRGFLGFDLSSVPEGLVKEATLSLHEFNKLNNMNSADLYLAKVTEAWDTSGNEPMFDQMVDSGSEQFIGTNGPASAGPVVDIDFNVDVAGFAQMWVDNPSSNDGLRLRIDDAFVGAAFSSTGPDAPKLRLVVQQIPEPMSAGLMLAGLGALSLRRQRR